MRFVGNHKSWMEEQKIVEHLTSCKGERSPMWQPDVYKGHPLLEKFLELGRPGYSDNKFCFHHLGPNSPEMENFKFTLPPLPETRNNLNWWFVKLYPGEFQAIHVDPHLMEVKNLVRYTMFLQDWEPGHIFVWDNKYIADYKSGDMFVWSDPTTPHGPANIGFSTRHTLQITMYD